MKFCKSLSCIAIIISAATISTQATAESYWGLGYSSFEMKGDISAEINNALGTNLRGLVVTNDLKGIEGVFGFEQNAFAAWEVRLGVGLGDDDVVLHYQGEATKVGSYKADTYFSGYFRPQYKTEHFQIYGLLGYSSISGSSSSMDGNSDDTSDDGFSYGIGAGVIFSSVNSINIEWKNLAKIDDGDIDGITLSYQRKY